MNVVEITRTHFGCRHDGELVPTRQSLLERLRDLNDHDSWREFYRTYWKLIYRAASKAGVSDQEAEEVVQEAMISVARTMETFRYEPAKCSFKGWLMHVTRRRVSDCLRKRRTQAQWFESLPPDAAADGPAREFPDAEAEGTFERMWTEEWERNLLDAAMERVKRHINPGHYQIFYLHAAKNMTAREIGKLLGFSALKVHVVCHRVAGKLKGEVRRLRNQQL